MAGSAIRGVAEVVINVRDLSAMTDFYRRALGLELHSQFPQNEPTIVFLTVSALDSALGRGGHPQLFALVDARRHIHTRDGYAGLDHQRSPLNHLAFEIDRERFEPEKRRLEALGLAVRTADFPHMRAKGMFFNDPEGNLIEMICHNGDSAPRPDVTPDSA